MSGKVRPPAIPIVVEIGLLGLGTVGEAVARAAQHAASIMAARGLDIRVSTALVRSREKARPAGAGIGLVTTDPDAFFDRRHDVVVEVLGGVEPAAALVSRALERGLPVVTANKSLLAVRGNELERLAAAHKVPLRFEASVVAGVPLLCAFANRPLAGTITQIEAILNGTTNFILTRMAQEDGEQAFDAALAEAQARGLAEPEPDADVSGRDAAEKLCLLLRYVAGVDLPVQHITTRPISGVTREEIAAARAGGGAIKPIARARIAADRIEATVGPVFVPGSNPLSRIDGALNGVLLESRYAGTLLYAGPGAGPDVTAATILDDVASIAASCAPAPR
jgi:homoserine dehydrogenase